jgi:hypothetical protein
VPVLVVVPARQRVKATGDVREARRGPVTQLGQRRGTADHDHAGDERDDAARLQRQLAGADLDPVAEDEHAEQDPDQRLARRDGRQRVLERAGVECALHEPDADRARADERVGRPGGEQRAGAVRAEGLQGLPGQRVLDAEHQARAGPGQQRPQPAGTLTSLEDEEERQPGDHGGGRPVGDRAEREADRLRGARRRQQRHPRAQHRRAEELPQPERRLGDRHGEDQGEDEVRGEQRLHEREREVADRPGGENLAGDHAADAGQPARLAQQVRDQFQRQEPRGGLALRGLLLQHEARADQQCGQQRKPVVQADVDIHGALDRCSHHLRCPW